MITKNFAWKLLGYGLGGSASFLFFISLMRYLGPTEYGRLAFALGWSGLFSILVDYGFNPIITRDLSIQPSHGSAYFSRITLAKSALGLASGATLLLISRLHASTRPYLSLIFFAFLYLLFSSFVETGQAFTYAYQKFKLGARLFICHKWLIAGLGLLGILARAGTLQIAELMALAACAGAGITYYYFRRIFGGLSTRTSPGDVKQILLEAFPLLVQNLFIVVYFRIDTVMLGWLRGDHETGLYNAAYRFFEVSNIIPTAFTAAIAAPFSRAIAENTWVSDFKKYMGQSLVLGILGCLVLQGIALILTRFFLTSVYSSSKNMLQVLGLTLLFQYPNYLLTSTLIYQKKQSWNAWIAAAGVLFNVAANLFAIPRWGGLGASWTTMATEAMISVASIYFIFQKPMHTKSL